MRGPGLGERGEAERPHRRGTPTPTPPQRVGDKYWTQRQFLPLGGGDHALVLSLSKDGGARAPLPDGNKLADSENTGTIYGVRIEAIEEPLMREIRYLDKLVDELAKGKAMGKVLREG